MTQELPPLTGKGIAWWQSLADKEKRCLMWPRFEAGCTNKQIEDEFELTPGTVAGRRTNWRAAKGEINIDPKTKRIGRNPDLPSARKGRPAKPERNTHKQGKKQKEINTTAAVVAANQELIANTPAKPVVHATMEQIVQTTQAGDRTAFPFSEDKEEQAAMADLVKHLYDL
jgi:hypothetical protein